MTRRTVFGSLLGLVLLVNLSRLVFAPLLTPLGRTFGVRAGTLGLVATAAWLGSALPRVPTGYLLTRVARERVVLGSGVVLTGAAVWTARAGTVRAVVVGSFLMGLASGAYFVAANPLVSELFPDRVGTALGVHGSAAQLGAVGAAPFVALALDVGSWRTALRLIAVAAAVTTAATAAAVRLTDLPAAGREDRGLPVAVRRNWRVVATGVILVGSAGLVWNGLFNFYVPSLTAAGVTEDRATVFLTVMFAAGLPAFSIAGRLADRVPVLRLGLLLVTGFAAGVVALTAVRGFLGHLVVGSAVGFAFYAVLPVADAYLLGSLPDRHRASAYAVYSGTMTFVQALGAALVGTLREAGMTYDVIFGALAIALLAAVGALAVLYQRGWMPVGAKTVAD